MTRGRRTAVVTGAVAAVLGLVAVALRMGLGSGHALAEADGPPPPLALGAIGSEPPKLRAWVEFGELLARPLFNESRAPEEQPDAGATDASAAQPLNVQLTGVILSGDLQLALVRDTTNGETARVRVGQPLEGAMAGWKLVELKPRLAVFDGAGLGRQELELTVDTKGAPPPPVAPPPVAAPAPGQPAPAAPPVVAGAQPGTAPAAAPAQAGQAASADEIRRRIEERRRQLREEAQRMLDQNPSN